MVKKIKNLSFLLLFFIFFLSVFKYYFSEKNIILTSKSRSSYIFTQKQNLIDLPILKNDTNNIIVYKIKKKSKKRIWEKLISNDK